MEPLPARPFPYITSIIGSLAVNHHCPKPLVHGWWLRSHQQIKGITIHHTLSYSPWATASYYITKGGGRPSIPYHYWVCGCGSVYLCLDLIHGCWHDHTGHENVNISIGLAGSLHVNRPSGPQLASTAALVVYLSKRLDLPTDQVRGHSNRSTPRGYPTICPGWNHARTGYWQNALMSRIDELVTRPQGEL